MWDISVSKSLLVMSTREMAENHFNVAFQVSFSILRQSLRSATTSATFKSRISKRAHSQPGNWSVSREPRGFCRWESGQMSLFLFFLHYSINKMRKNSRRPKYRAPAAETSCRSPHPLSPNSSHTHALLKSPVPTPAMQHTDGWLPQQHSK